VALCDDRIEGITARPRPIQYEGAGEETVIDTPLEKLGPFLVRFEPLVAVRPLS
jgi:hypothetical protein